MPDFLPIFPGRSIREISPSGYQEMSFAYARKGAGETVLVGKGWQARIPLEPGEGALPHHPVAGKRHKKEKEKTDPG